MTLRDRTAIGDSTTHGNTDPDRIRRPDGDILRPVHHRARVRPFPRGQALRAPHRGVLGGVQEDLGQDRERRGVPHRLHPLRRLRGFAADRFHVRRDHRQPGQPAAARGTVETHRHGVRRAVLQHHLLALPGHFRVDLRHPPARPGPLQRVHRPLHPGDVPRVSGRAPRGRPHREAERPHVRYELGRVHADDHAERRQREAGHARRGARGRAAADRLHAGDQ